MEATFEGHGRAGHCVLQARNGTVVALTSRRLASLLAVVLDQGMQLVAAAVQRAGKVQCNIG
jgi:hypothetical protein